MKINQNFKIAPIKLEMHFYETYDIPLDNFDNFGFRGILTSRSDVVNAYLLRLS